MASSRATQDQPLEWLCGTSEQQRLIFAALAGIFVTLGLPPLPLTGILVVPGLAWFFLQLERAERPGRVAWIFGLAHQLTLLHWLFFLIPAKSIPTRALVPAQAMAAIGYVALFYLVFGWLYGRARGRLGRHQAWLLIPVFYTGMEILRDRGELAFPWCLTGSCVVGTPLMGLARTSGEAGIGLALVFTAVALVSRLDRRPGDRLLAFTALGLWLALAAGSLVSGPAPTTPPLKVAAVQADVSLDEKWDKTKLDATTVPYTDLTRQAASEGAQFVVWAETAIPAYVRFDRELMNWVRDLVREQQVILYTGFPDAQREADGTTRKFNSSGLFDRQGTLIDRYAKHHLLPIGEAMPFTRYFPALAKIDVGQAEWSPGAPPQVMTASGLTGELPFSGLICFESILGRLSRQSVLAGSRCLVVLTNDGWFGKTAGPLQHTALARMRAAESGVPLIRCANNGVSLITDERGQVLDSLGLGSQGLVSATIAPGRAGTLFVRFGTVPLLIFLLGWVLVAMLRPSRGDS